MDPNFCRCVEAEEVEHLRVADDFGGCSFGNREVLPVHGGDEPLPEFDASGKAWFAMLPIERLMHG